MKSEIVERPEKQNPESETTPLAVEIVSFGFKNGAPPPANIVLDVRFLKNPYWVDELRPLTGLDAPVRKYVLDQTLAQDVLENLIKLVEHTAPAMLKAKVNTFIIALGCTGGQHRSTAMVEALGERVRSHFTEYNVTCSHRELARLRQEAEANFASEDGQVLTQDIPNADSRENTDTKNRSENDAVTAQGSA
jgi:RNase adapter protein RapZ